MNEGPSSNGWWQTLPGILTATTGIITAAAGLIVVLNQAGFFERESQTPPHVKEDVPTPSNSTGSSQASTSTTVPRAPTGLIPQVAGTWQIVQSGSQDLVGTLHLSQNGTVLSGNLVWNTLAPATLVSGEVSERSLRFVVRYDGGVEGAYEGKLNASFDLVEGTARGQGQSVPWKALRQ